MRRRILALVLVVVAAAACAPASGATPDDRVQVVATTTILADLARQVGGDRVAVESLVPKGGEAHTFDPRPSDVRRIVQADLIVRNGLGLDDWLVGLIADAGGDGRTVVLGEDLPDASYIGDEEGAHGAVNPHLWLDVANARRYAARIADALAGIDPGHAATYRDRAADYDAELAALDADAHARFAAIPEPARTVISFHDAFPYFAAAYGLTIDGTVVDAPGQDPSAAQVAGLVRAIREHGVRAILAEAQFSDDLVQAIAAESGATVVSDLYTDSVGDAPLDSYAAVMRWNLDRIAEALGS